MVVVKLIVFALKRKKMVEIMMKLNELYIQAIPIENTRLRNVTESATKEVQLILKAFSGAFMVFVFYLITPWIIYFKTGEKVPSFPTKFPFEDNANWAIYLFIYFMENKNSLTTVVSFLCEGLFIAFVNMVCTRFDALAEMLRLHTNSVQAEVTSNNILGDSIKYQIKIYK